MFNTETMLSYELADCARSGPASNLLTDHSKEYESQTLMYLGVRSYGERATVIVSED
jgi:hypothetical protein